MSGTPTGWRWPWWWSVGLLVACHGAEGVHTEPSAAASLPVGTRPGATTRAALPRVPQVQPAVLTRVVIARPTGETASLERRGERWWLTHPLEVRANRATVEPLVALLAEIEAVAGGPADGAAAWVDETHGIGVQAWAGEQRVSDLVVGRSVADHTYVRVAGDPRVLAVRGRCRSVVDLTVDALRDPVITDVPIASIARVRYETPDGPLELRADPRAPGSLVPADAGARLHASRLGQGVLVLAQLRARGFVDVSDPAAAALFDDTGPRVTLWRRDGAPITVSIGARTGDRRLAVRTSESDTIYLVSAHLASSLVPRRSRLEAPVPSDDSQGAARPAHEDHPHAPQPVQRHVPAEMLAELRAMAAQQR